MATSNIEYIYGVENIDQFFHRVARELRRFCARSADELADAIDAGDPNVDMVDDEYGASAHYKNITIDDETWLDAEFVTCSGHGVLVAVCPTTGAIYIDADDIASDTFWGDSGIFIGDTPENARADLRASNFLARLFLTDEEVDNRYKKAEATRAVERRAPRDRRHAPAL